MEEGGGLREGGPMLPKAAQAPELTGSQVPGDRKGSRFFPSAEGRAVCGAGWVGEGVLWYR